VLGDEHEDDFLAEWLANKQVKQSTVRQAAKRESDRVRDQLNLTAMQRRWVTLRS
jgi:hypothetical protein